MTEPLGFVGLGQMGQPLALNLLHAGYALRVFDLHAERMMPLLEQGAIRATHLAAIAHSDLIFSMVPDDAALRQVVLASDGLLHALAPGSILVSCSTISPALASEVAQCAAERGCAFVSATVLGRPDVAAQGRLTLFVSGPAAAKARVMPLLSVLGTHVYDLGEDVTAATAAKLGANLLILAALAAMGEAVAFVERYGVPRAAFLRMMVQSPLFAGAVYEGYGAMIGQQDYHDARFPVPLGYKDATLLLQAAEQEGLPLPLTRYAHDALQAAQCAGRGDEDWSVLAEYVSTALASFSAAQQTTLVQGGHA